MYEATLAELDAIAGETPHTVQRSGSLRIAESDEEGEDCEAQLAAMRADGLSVGGVRGPGGARATHSQATVPSTRWHVAARWRNMALASGARCSSEHAPQTSRRRRSPRRAASSAQQRSSSPSTVRWTCCSPNYRGDVRTARLQMLGTAATREVTITRPVYARWGYDYWQQRPDGTIALGGARDVGGESEWTHDATPTDVVQAALEHRLREKLGVSAAITHRWAAIVSYTPDDLPIVREVRRGVWAIGGYSGTGNVIGSLLGRGLARLIRRGDDVRSASLFSRRAHGS